MNKDVNRPAAYETQLYIFEEAIRGEIEKGTQLAVDIRQSRINEDSDI